MEPTEFHRPNLKQLIQALNRFNLFKLLSVSRFPHVKMKGTWLLPENDRKAALEKLKTPHILRILEALKAKGKDGLSNAEIDSLLGTESQWLIFWDLRELMALGVVEFDVQLFGEAGKYRLTPAGPSILQEIQEA